jgi:hemolysin activation/secretion protein
MTNKNKSRWVTRVAGIALVSCALGAEAQVPQQMQVDTASPISRFEITRFEVQGNTLLPAALVDSLLAPYAGPDRDFGSVQKALETLEAAYREKGYSIVRVVLPEQELNRGVVHLRVIETKIGKINVEGNKFFDEANIRRSVPGLKEGETPNLNQVAASLKDANENPAKKTTLKLQTGDQDDQVNADLQVIDEKPWNAGISVDNTGVGNTGRNHITALYQNNNIGGIDHVLSMQYTTSLSDPSNVTVLGAGYHVPLYALADSFDFYGSYSNVNSGTVSAGVFNLAVSGKGTVLGARYNHNFARSGDYDSKLIFGLDYKAFQNDVSEAGLPIGNDVTVHPLSITYTGNWSNNSSTVNYYASGLHNIPGGDNGVGEDFSMARVHASPNYEILRYGASYSYAFPKDWQLRLVLNGQVTDDALVQGEQFGIGGANSVRGFDEREIADDQGRSTSAELYTPNLCNGGALCRLLGFYDTGYVTHNDALPGELMRQSIGSIGVGLRLSVDRYFVLQTDFAHVVDGTDATPKGSNRVHFRAVLTY